MQTGTSRRTAGQRAGVRAGGTTAAKLAFRTQTGAGAGTGKGTDPRPLVWDLLAGSAVQGTRSGCDARCEQSGHRKPRKEPARAPGEAEPATRDRVARVLRRSGNGDPRSSDRPDLPRLA